MVICVLFLSVSLYTVGKYKYKAKTSRAPPRRVLRRWGHNDGNDVSYHFNVSLSQKRRHYYPPCSISIKSRNSRASTSKRKQFNSLQFTTIAYRFGDKNNLTSNR